MSSYRQIYVSSFISNLYTFESPRVRSFVDNLPKAGIHGSLQYVTKNKH